MYHSHVPPTILHINMHGYGIPGGADLPALIATYKYHKVNLYVQHIFVLMVTDRAANSPVASTGMEQMLHQANSFIHRIWADKLCIYSLPRSNHVGVAISPVIV